MRQPGEVLAFRDDAAPQRTAPRVRTVLIRAVAALLAMVVLGELVLLPFSSRLDGRLVHYHGEAQVKAEQLAAARSAASPGSTPAPDLVFVGNSTVLHGLDPASVDEVLGTTSYNAALVGAIPQVTAPWIRDHVLANVTPSTVVWGLTSWDANSGPDFVVVDEFEHAPISGTGRLRELDRRVGRVSRLVRYRAVLRDPTDLASLLRRGTTGEIELARSRIAPDGFLVDHTAESGERARAVTAGLLADFEVGGRPEESLREGVGDLRADGVDVVFVLMPVPDRYVDQHPRGAADHTAALAHLRSVAAELDVAVIDLHDLLGEDDFVDYSHVTEDAAVRLSTRVAQELGRLG